MIYPKRSWTSPCVSTLFPKTPNPHKCVPGASSPLLTYPMYILHCLLKDQRSGPLIIVVLRPNCPSNRARHSRDVEVVMTSFQNDPEQHAWLRPWRKGTIYSPLSSTSLPAYSHCFLLFFKSPQSFDQCVRLLLPNNEFTKTTICGAFSPPADILYLGTQTSRPREYDCRSASPQPVTSLKKSISVFLMCEREALHWTSSSPSWQPPGRGGV
jgi:hypothetical protein